MEALRPDVVLIMLCGFGVERSRREWERFVRSEAGSRARRLSVPVWVIDGNAFTSRPGPRVVDGADRIAAALAGRSLPDVVRLA